MGIFQFVFWTGLLGTSIGFYNMAMVCIGFVRPGGILGTNALCRARSASKCILSFDLSALLVGSLSNRLWYLPIVSPVL